MVESKHIEEKSIILANSMPSTLNTTKLDTLELNPAEYMDCGSGNTTPPRLKKESFSSNESSPPSVCHMKLKAETTHSNSYMMDINTNSNNSQFKVESANSNLYDSKKHQTPATPMLAKFKAAQDLHIETAHLSPDTKESYNNAGTDISTPKNMNSSNEKSSAKDGTNTILTPKTPLPPKSTGKKRHRRTAEQIDRKFSCKYPDCKKAYGSEGSLTQHQRLKHFQSPVEPPTTPRSDISAFLLPLHTPGGGKNHNSCITTPPRTVSIRPALGDGTQMLTHYSFDMAMAAAGYGASPNNDLVAHQLSETAAAVSLTSSTSSNNLNHSFISSYNGSDNLSGNESSDQDRRRVRSNSMPVSFPPMGNFGGMQQYHSIEYGNTPRSTGRSNLKASHSFSAKRNRSRSSLSKTPIARRGSRGKANQGKEVGSDSHNMTTSCSTSLSPTNELTAATSDFLVPKINIPTYSPSSSTLSATDSSSRSLSAYEWHDALGFTASRTTNSQECNTIDDDILAMLVDEGSQDSNTNNLVASALGVEMQTNPPFSAPSRSMSCDYSNPTYVEQSTTSELNKSFNFNSNEQQDLALESLNFEIPNEDFQMSSAKDNYSPTTPVNPESWMSAEDAKYLSQHLNRMTMVNTSPTGRENTAANATTVTSLPPIDTTNLAALNASLSDPLGAHQTPMEGLSFNSFNMQRGFQNSQLNDGSQNNLTDDSTKLTSSASQQSEMGESMWMKDFSLAPSLSSNDLGTPQHNLIIHDGPENNVSSYEPDMSMDVVRETLDGWYE